MRHLRHPLLIATLGLAALAAGVAGVAQSAAAQAGDDVVLSISLGHDGGTDFQATTTGPSFQLFFVITTTAGLPQTVTLTVPSLPAGLHWAGDPRVGILASDPTVSCQGTAPLVCSQPLQADNGVVAGGVYDDVVADRPGTYSVTATVDTTLPDPNLSNNTVTFQFQVTQSSGGSGGSASVTATAAKIAPTKPKAGSIVTATVRVAAGGAPVKPTQLACAGKIGTTKLAGKGKTADGSVTCRYATPHGAKGKTLRGTIAFTVGSTKITKRFSARLN